MRTLKTLSEDVYSKDFIHIWWYYNFDELMNYAKSVGLKVDESIIKARSNKKIARFIKESVSGGFNE